MLLKPTFAVPHGGGKRFSTDSLEYRVICGMDRGGRATAGRSAMPQVTGLEVFPASAALKPGAEQQMVVRAKYSDGRRARRDALGEVQLERRRRGLGGRFRAT